MSSVKIENNMSDRRLVWPAKWGVGADFKSICTTTAAQIAFKTLSLVVVFIALDDVVIYPPPSATSPRHHQIDDCEASKVHYNDEQHHTHAQSIFESKLQAIGYTIHLHSVILVARSIEYGHYLHTT